MRWTERQRAMLREMGVQLWARGAGAEDGAGVEQGTGAEKGVGAEHGGDAEHGGGARHGTAAMGSRPETALSQTPCASPAAFAAPAVSTSPPLAAAAPDWRPAECLVVCDAAESAPGDDGGADRLLVRLLHAVQLSPDVPGPAGRACRLALPTGPSADLDAAIAAVRPRAILALGRTAAQVLLGSDEPLGRLRGRLQVRAGVPVVVSFAPAYLLRHPEEKAKAWADLCLLARALEPTSA